MSERQSDAEVNEVTRTAPQRIWLQISDDDEHCAETFPLKDWNDSPQITWCEDSVLACQVAYVRADLFRSLRDENARLTEALEYIELCIGANPPAQVLLPFGLLDSVRTALARKAET